MKYSSILTISICVLIFSLSSCSNSEVGKWIKESNYGNKTYMLVLESDNTYRFQINDDIKCSGNYEKLPTGGLKFSDGSYSVAGMKFNLNGDQIIYEEEKDYIRSHYGHFFRD